MRGPHVRLHGAVDDTTTQYFWQRLKVRVLWPHWQLNKCSVLMVQFDVTSSGGTSLVVEKGRIEGRIALCCS